MVFVKNWQRSGGIMRVLIINLVCCLACLSSVVLAQLEVSEGVTGFVTTCPTLGITCLGNLAVFVTSLIRGRLDLEIGARDILDILISPILKNINGIKHGNGMTTCRGNIEDADVVMLSNGTPNWAMRLFMKSSAPIVKSIVLQFLRFKDAMNDALVGEEVTTEMCECRDHECRCTVFWTMEEITIMVACTMPGVLKLLSNSLCLLPCLTCLRNGCHGCNDEGLMRVEGPLPMELSDEGYKLRDNESKVVSEILDKIIGQSIQVGEPICICIPMHGSSSNLWTELLVRSLRSKDAEGRGVRVMASEALEGYLAGRRRGAMESVEYNIVSFIMPRLAEILINLALTFWFKVDGFSSASVARRTIRDYLVDSKGTGFAGSAFLTKAVVKSDANNTQVCQVLTFRGNLLCIVTFISTGCANLICFLGWAVLISFEGGADSSPTLSMPIVVVILGAIGTALGMDVAGACFALWDDDDFKSEMRSVVLFLIICTATSPVLLPVLGITMWLTNNPDPDFPGVIMFVTGVAWEMVYIVSGSAVAGTLGIKGFGRWVYATLQVLVWFKWAIGSYNLNEENSIEFFGRNPDRNINLWYSSAFLLNAVLAGVRCKWEAWPWKENQLFSRKMGP